MQILQTIGIDPGKTGGIASITTDGRGRGTLDVWDMPISEQTGDPCPFELHRILKDCQSDANRIDVYIEKVGSRPGQGVVSTFNFGVGYGIVKAAVAIHCLPMTLIPPATWKPRMRIKSGGTKTQKKDRAMARASELLPFCKDMWPLKKHDGRAEAALIAVYGHMSEGTPITVIEAGTLNGKPVA